MAQTVKNLPAVQETWVRSLDREDGMATLSSIRAWRIPWTEEPGGLQSMGSQRVRHDSVTNTFTFLKELKDLDNLRNALQGSEGWHWAP